MSVSLLSPAGARDESADEIELIRRVQTGDTDAFGELYHQNLAKVINFLRSQLPLSPADAEDIAADAFLTALTKIDRFSLDESGRFVNWLIGIARFRALHHRTHRATHPELELLEWSDLRLADDRVIDAEQAVVDRLEVAALLARLSTDQRRALVLQHAFGLASAEVAGRMGMTRRSLWKLTERARNVLREERRASETEPDPATLCACGCGAELPVERHHSRRYATDACRARINADLRKQRQESAVAGPATEDPALERVLAVIVAAGSAGIGRKALTRQVRLTVSRLDGIVGLLVRRRLISVALEPAVRRPITRYRALASAAAGRAA
jgi:RNA polymerase sigma factor (sigma-70 family)